MLVNTYWGSGHHCLSLGLQQDFLSLVFVPSETPWIVSYTNSVSHIFLPIYHIFYNIHHSVHFTRMMDLYILSIVLQCLTHIGLLTKIFWCIAFSENHIKQWFFKKSQASIVWDLSTVFIFKDNCFARISNRNLGHESLIRSEVWPGFIDC